jgi:geranylgeranyl pyrophosphate synthase
MAAQSYPFPLSDYQLSVRQYLGRYVFPADSVAGRIIEERLPAHQACDSLRPSLVLWTCEAAKGDRADALPVAAAFDLFDRFLLLHEELTDGQTATVARWGLGQSLNAGDALYALAFRTLAGDVIHPQWRLDTAKLVGEAVLEAIDARDERARDAVLTGAAMAAGARIAGCDARSAGTFANAGKALMRDTAEAVVMLREVVTPQALTRFEDLARYVARRTAR